MRAQGGLTLLEAVAVLALLAVLVVAAVPNLFPSGAAVRSTAEQLVADLSLARQLAMSRGEAHVVQFGPSGSAYTQYTVRRGTGSDEPGFPRELPAGVTAQGPESVTLLPSGAAQLSDPWVQWNMTSASESAVVRLWRQTGYARVLR